MQAVRFLVLRHSTQELTVATVTAEVDRKELANEAGFLDALMEATTEWVNTSESGRDEWIGSSEDFNVGDLAYCQGDRDLVWLLAKRGIHRLRIEVFSEVGHVAHWTYDTVLVDREKVGRH